MSTPKISTPKIYILTKYTIAIYLITYQTAPQTGSFKLTLHCVVNAEIENLDDFKTYFDSYGDDNNHSYHFELMLTLQQ